MSFPPEPTVDQCKSCEQFEHKGRPGIYIPYPSIGGVAAKAAAVHLSSLNDEVNVYVWKSGETPSDPILIIKNCKPEQYAILWHELIESLWER